MRAGLFAALAVTAALSFCCVSAGADAKPFGISRQRFDVGSWQITIQTDRFSAIRRCRLALRRGNALYVDQAVVFDLGKHVDVSEATVRIDQGAPMLWRDVIPELAASVGDPFLDPRAKRLPVPIRLLEGAGHVAIAPKFGRKPRVFKVDGFALARQNALKAGCGPDDAFLR